MHLNKAKTFSERVALAILGHIIEPLSEKKRRVKFPYWGVLNNADSLCIKISPIFYIANPNPNPAGPSTLQYGNYPKRSTTLSTTFESHCTLNFRKLVR